MLNWLKDFFALRRSVMVLSLIGTLWVFGFGMWVQFMPKYFEAVSGDIVLAGILISVYYGFLSLAHAFSGFLADIYGRKSVLIMLLLIGIPGLFFYFLAGEMWLFLIPGMFFWAFSASYRRTIDSTMITESVHKNKMATSRAVIDIPILISWSVAAFIGGFLVNKMGILDGFRNILLVAILVSAAAALFAYFNLKETLHKRHRKVKFSLDPFLFTRFLTKLPRQVKYLIIANSVGLFGWSMMFNYMIFYAIDVIKITPLEWGVIAGMHLLFFGLFAFVGAKVSDRYGRKYPIVVMFAAAAVLPIFFILSTGFMQLLAVSSLWGMLGFGLSSLEAFTADHTPKSGRGRSVGICNSVFILCAIPAPAIGGILFVMSPQLPFVVSALIGTISLFLGWKLLK
jgi:MFS family permease